MKEALGFEASSRNLREHGLGRDWQIGHDGGMLNVIVGPPSAMGRTGLD